MLPILIAAVAVLILASAIAVYRRRISRHPPDVRPPKRRDDGPMPWDEP